MGRITKDYYYIVSFSCSDLPFCVIFRLKPGMALTITCNLFLSSTVETGFLLLQISLGLSIAEPINSKGMEILGLPLTNECLGTKCCSCRELECNVVNSGHYRNIVATPRFTKQGT